MSHPIPIQNIYFLLCYAWDSLPESGLVDISKDGIDKPIDLLAKVLVNGARHIVRRGLEQGYVSEEAELASIRGRAKVAQSARRLLLQQGKVLCEFDELTVSTIPNQIVKATLLRVHRSSDVDPNIRHEAGVLVRQLDGIADVRLSRQQFRRVQLHSNNRFYRFVIQVCWLLMDQSLMDESDGVYRFRDFTRDDNLMSQLYEKFLFNFYRKQQSNYQVKKERIYWQAASFDDPGLHLLPTMETDISLRSPTKTLIIDAKFYRKTLQSYFSNESVHSANLYQIFSYLKNLENRGGNDLSAEGMLLYPVVHAEVSRSYEVQGHSIRIETVDLAQDWKNISRSLLALVA